MISAGKSRSGPIPAQRNFRPPNECCSLRVEAFARASLATSPESLAAFCRRYGARQLVVPPSTQLLSIAMLTGDPLVAKLQNAQPLTPAEADKALVRMMVYGRDEPPLRKVFEQGLWRVYALPDSAS